MCFGNYGCEPTEMGEVMYEDWSGISPEIAENREVREVQEQCMFACWMAGLFFLIKRGVNIQIFKKYIETILLMRKKIMGMKLFIYS